MYYALALLISGICLSGLFSGSETGFYRATRVRWVLDGKAGDRLSRLLLWWANNPSVFVANILIGNNLANYLVSLSIVLLVKNVFASDAQWIEFLAPVLLTPVLFVYGESLPKNLFLQAPNRLIRWVAPVLALFNLLFTPAAVVLWGLSRILEFFLGKSPEQIRSRLARKELLNVLREGHNLGILEPVQLQLAQNFFDLVDKSLDPISIPLPRVIYVTEGSTVGKAIQIANKNRLTNIPIADKNAVLIGYVSIEEILLKDDADKIVSYHPFAIVSGKQSVGRSLIQMRRENADLALIMDDLGKPKGMLAVQRLYAQLFTGSLVRWKR